MDRVPTGNIARFPRSVAMGDLWDFAVQTWDQREQAQHWLNIVEETQRTFEEGLLSDDDKTFTLDGRCAMCGTFGPMQVSYMYAANHSKKTGRLLPNWREHLDCKQCRYPNRIRAAMHFMRSAVNPARDQKIYITEKVTPLYQWLSQQFDDLHGSEYLGAGIAGGTEIDGTRHEDLTALSYQDDSFDLLLTFDVVEHVVDLEQAIVQMARVIKPGGHLIMTAPTSLDRYETLERARVTANGSIEHMLPAEYHGNPVDPDNGSLCFRYLGLDVLDRLRAAGFQHAELVQYWSRYYGYLGPGQVLFFAKK